MWSAWEDTDQTRNRNEGDWTDTDPLETMGEPPDVEKKQTRTITWEQEQTRTSETCDTIEPQWLEASETETRWVPVTPPPPVIPPKPTNDQWNFRYSNNKLQSMVISLPTVTPAITGVELTMETGQPPNLTTVVKTLDVANITIGEYTTVLSSADTGWQTGTWIAQIRFQNSLAFGPYSDVKSDTVPTPETCIWQDVSPSETRNRVEGEWTDTGRTRENPVTLIVEKEQTRTITWEKQQQCTSGSTTHYQWVSDSRTETQWVESSPCTWTDTGQTRVDRYGSWSRTGRTQGSGADREREGNVLYTGRNSRVVPPTLTPVIVGSAPPLPQKLSGSLTPNLSYGVLGGTLANLGSRLPASGGTPVSIAAPWAIESRNRLGMSAERRSSAAPQTTARRRLDGLPLRVPSRTGGSLTPNPKSGPRGRTPAEPASIP